MVRTSSTGVIHERTKPFRWHSRPWTRRRSKAGKLHRAEPKVFHDGETLFAVGDRNINFFIVKSGEVEIVDDSGDEPKTITIHRPGEFTGDISHVTGLPAVVSAIARGDCEVYEITGDALRSVLNQCPMASATSSCRRSSRGGSFCASRPTSPGCA